MSQLDLLGKLPVRMVQSIAAECLAGLAYLHQNKVKAAFCLIPDDLNLTKWLRFFPGFFISQI